MLKKISLRRLIVSKSPSSFLGCSTMSIPDVSMNPGLRVPFSGDLFGVMCIYFLFFWRKSQCARLFEYCLVIRKAEGSRTEPSGNAMVCSTRGGPNQDLSWRILSPKTVNGLFGSRTLGSKLMRYNSL